MKNNRDDLIVKRIRSFTDERNINYILPYRISLNAGMNPSTLNNILSGKFKDLRFSTIEKICKGLNISIKDFFDDNLFN